MSTRIIVVNIKQTEVAEQLNIILSIDSQQYCYCVEIFDIQGLKGISIKKGDDLADILCRNREKHREFRSLIISVYQGKKIDMPLDLGDF